MKENISLLKSRVFDALDNTKETEISRELDKIDGPVITSGVGGSRVVSNFASKVLGKNNRVLSVSKEPRDMLHEELEYYEYVLACSYSGNNYGVDSAFNNDLTKFLLSSNKRDDIKVNNVTYNITLPREHSFVSLAQTLIPMSILLRYYTKNGKFVKDLVKEYSFDDVGSSDIYEIMSGCDTSVCASFIESSLVEGGVAIPIVHDKYSYCHGRSTMSDKFSSNMIFFDTSTPLDRVLLEEIKDRYDKIIKLGSGITDEIISEYINTLQSIYLCYCIAESKGKDLSVVDYNPSLKKLYKFNNGM